MITPYGWNVNVWWEPNPAMLWRTRQALELLQPDRWMDYYCAEPIEFPGYIPTIRSWHLDNIVPTEVVSRLTANPTGETWIFLNEPHHTEQDGITPAMGRDLAMKFLQLARSVDSDINWCGPNCTSTSPAQPGELYAGSNWWREWLKLMRRAGLARPSYHGLHGYHSSNRSAVLDLRNKLTEWRWQWIGDGPLIITEASGENQRLETQIEVMDELWNLYNVGRQEGPTSKSGILGVFWFAAWDGGLWPNTALTEIDPTKNQTMRLTPLGQHWLNLKRR